MFIDYERLRESGLRGAARSLELVYARGFTHAGQKLWSEAELEALRRHFPDYAALARHLPGRSKKAIELRAARLGITTRHSRPWTTVDNRTLRQLWATMSVVHLAKLMQRRESSLHRHARKLGLPRKGRSLKATGIRNYDELRTNARKLNYTMRDLSEITRSGGYFRNPSRRAGKGLRRYIHEARAAKALGGKIVIKWPEE